MIATRPPLAGKAEIANAALAEIGLPQTAYIYGKIVVVDIDLDDDADEKTNRLYYRSTLLGEMGEHGPGYMTTCFTCFYNYANLHKGIEEECCTVAEALQGINDCGQKCKS